MKIPDRLRNLVAENRAVLHFAVSDEEMRKELRHMLLSLGLAALISVPVGVCYVVGQQTNEFFTITSRAGINVQGYRALSPSEPNTFSGFYFSGSYKGPDRKELHVLCEYGYDVRRQNNYRTVHPTAIFSNGKMVWDDYDSRDYPFVSELERTAAVICEDIYMAIEAREGREPVLPATPTPSPAPAPPLLPPYQIPTSPESVTDLTIKL